MTDNKVTVKFTNYTLSHFLQFMYFMNHDLGKRSMVLKEFKCEALEVASLDDMMDNVFDTWPKIDKIELFEKELLDDKCFLTSSFRCTEALYYTQKQDGQDAFKEYRKSIVVTYFIVEVNTEFFYNSLENLQTFLIRMLLDLPRNKECHPKKQFAIYINNQQVFGSGNVIGQIMEELRKAVKFYSNSSMLRKKTKPFKLQNDKLLRDCFYNLCEMDSNFVILSEFFKIRRGFLSIEVGNIQTLLHDCLQKNKLCNCNFLSSMSMLSSVISEMAPDIFLLREYVDIIEGEDHPFHELVLYENYFSILNKRINFFKRAWRSDSQYGFNHIDMGEDSSFLHISAWDCVIEFIYSYEKYMKDMTRELMDLLSKYINNGTISKKCANAVRLQCCKEVFDILQSFLHELFVAKERVLVNSVFNTITQTPRHLVYQLLRYKRTSVGLLDLGDLSYDECFPEKIKEPEPKSDTDSLLDCYKNILEYSTEIINLKEKKEDM